MAYQSFNQTNQKVPKILTAQTKARADLDSENITKVNIRPETFLKSVVKIPVFIKKKIFYGPSYFDENYYPILNTDFSMSLLFEDLPEQYIHMLHIVPIFYSSSGNNMDSFSPEIEFYAIWEKKDQSNYMLRLHYSGAVFFDDDAPLYLDLTLYFLSEYTFNAI